MRVRLAFIPLALASSSAFAQPADDPGQFEITNNVVPEQTYELPDARSAGLFDERNPEFYRNAGNLNSGTLNNSRLASDLGNRTIGNARHADRSDRADRADRATRADRADRATLADRARRADIADFATTAGSASSADSATTVAFALRAGTADNADRFDGRTASFYRNASNLNSGTLNNSRLNSDLGNRSIENARTADFAEDAANAGGTTGGQALQIGATRVFSRSRRSGTASQSYSIPTGTTYALIEARCSTRDNDAGSSQHARVELAFNSGFTTPITICEAGRNHSDRDTPVTAGSTQFDIPRGATAVRITQSTIGGDDPSVTSGNLYWFGPNGTASSGGSSGGGGSTIPGGGCTGIGGTICTDLP